MHGINPRWLKHFCSASLVILLLIVPALAESDPNPDSPTPILISHSDSTRALVNLHADSDSKNLTKSENQAFAYDSRIVLYVTNLDIMKDEGASAFRVYVEDQNGRKYRFPVLEIEQLRGQEWVYALTVHLKDDLGFWKEAPARGDVLINLTWRGLSSNKVKLGLGEIGGKIKEDVDAVPTPFPKERIITETSEPDYVGYRHSGDRLRFLEQATFGPTVALDQRLRRIGLRTWLAEQLEMPYPSASNPYPNIPLKNTDSGNATNGCGMFTTGTPERNICNRDHYSMYPVQNWFFKEALYGEPQLRHRVAWSLGQIWVVSGVDTQQSSWMIAYHQKLSEHAFGNYRNLMKDMTLNPAMGNYLDMMRSTRNNPNENFAREILQLFSIGLFMLNQDGTLKLDGNGNPIPTYTQETVNNFTKVFTGWNTCETTGASCPNRTLGVPNYKDPMLLNQNNHDVTAKTLLDYPNAVNRNIPSALNGNTEIDLALDNIFNHPNVAPFISKLLIQHMVTSDPTPAYVGRVAAAFNNNGQGVRGDMKSVVRAILLDPEARGNVKTDPNYGKLREPVQFITNFLKHFNVSSANLSQQSDGVINGLTAPLGQNVFNAPTVFNYYSPDYVIPGTSLLGPEFGILTTGTAIARTNAIYTMTFNRINAGTNNPLGTAINLSEMVSLAQADPTGNQLLDVLNQRLMHGTMSAQMKNTILTAVLAIASSNPTARAQQAVYLVATSSQYQVQR